MDTKIIGEFLKELRKEKGLTQEQLAEILLVSGRTVSRWETGTNMPDLSVLIQMAEFYGVEIKEILDGERKSEIMDKEIKETISKDAEYNKLDKKKLQKPGNIPIVNTKTVHISIPLFIGIAILGFAVLRILAYCNSDRKEKNEIIRESKQVKEIQPVNVFTANGNMQADMIVEALKKNGILAYKQDLGDAGFASVRYGMGRGTDDRVAIFVASEKTDDAITVIKGMGLS